MVRFAPSPTGDMHIGNLRVALFNYVIAKQKNEKYLIRIEDTDNERNIEGKDKEILQILKIFGIEYDQVVYQSENFKVHWKFATDLLSQKKAFVCFCTPDEIEKQRQIAQEEKRPYRYSGKCEELSDIEVLQREDEPFVVRLKKPKENIKFFDYIKGEMEFSPFDIDSFVILRQNKIPTYNFACAIDDMIYDISLIIRGEDHLSNTPKQIAIQKALGYEKEIKYAHLPIILNIDGKKMSKRDSASSVKWLLEEGFLPEAIANYLILLGNKTPKEIFSLQEAIEFFDLSKLSKSPAKFDIDKLRFINHEHLKQKDDLASLLQIHKSLNALAKVYLEEASTLKELKAKIDEVLAPRGEFEEWQEEIELIKKEILDNELEDDYNEFKNRISKNTGLKGKKLFMPLRLVLTNQTHGPNISDIYPAMKHLIKEIVNGN
ncbi:MAG: glutamate--tRNA ligase [Epsilonproteobacteria bacterium]|nr:glutamate--tRNA ligase [Campylobacterota bacterium]